MNKIGPLQERIEAKEVKVLKLIKINVCFEQVFGQKLSKSNKEIDIYRKSKLC